MLRQLNLVVLASGLLIIGCSKQQSTWDRIPVTGNVTVNKVPYDGGLVFQPETGNSGPAATATCAEGKFACNASTGPVSGEYRAMLMPKTGSQIEFEVIELSVVIPKDPPFEMNLAFETQIEVDVASFAPAPNMSQPAGFIPQGATSGTTADGGGYGAGPLSTDNQTTQATLAEEEEEGKSNSKTKVPQRGPGK